MKRWAIAIGCVLSLVGCSGDDSEGGGSAGNAGSGAGAGATSGSAGSGGVSGGTGGTGGDAGTSSMAGTGGTGAGAGGSAGTATSGSGGSAGSSGTSAGGASGTSGEGGSGGQSCGGRGQMECPGGSYCNYPDEADCGRFDAPGVCTALTDILCGDIYQPVCGCDGETYPNACSAAQAGMSVDHEGECEAPEGGYTCTLEGVACLIAIPECQEGYVISTNGSCIGPCVPIEECKCGGPDDCPYPEKYTCWMSAGHCGPYTQ